MKIKELVAPLEEFAPLAWQADYDNSGLIVGRPDDEISAALVCLDATEDVLDEAQQLGCQLVISHHPVIFHPLRRLNGEGYVERIIERAIRCGIALYACHTNLDSAPGGMSFTLANILGITNLQLLGAQTDGQSQSPDHGFGVIGTLPHPADPLDFLRKVKQKLNIKTLRHSDLPDIKIQKIAICSGSGGSLIETAKRPGADLYIAADFKYNDFMAGETGATTSRPKAEKCPQNRPIKPFIVADIGHFESEFCAIDLIHNIISKNFVNFALHKSAKSRNPVNYLI